MPGTPSACAAYASGESYSDGETKGREEMTDREQPYIVSSSPHAHSGSSVRGIMLDVIIAMIPAIVVALMFFGMDALRLLVTCVASCLVAELLCRIAMKRDLAINDLSAVVTGILLAFNLPPALPTWMAVVGCITAIVIAKQLFGGLGYNPFNPALVARAVLLASRAPEMTSWSEWMVPGTDAVTSATPLALAADKASFVFDGPVALAMLIGKTNGCIGEVSALALIIGRSTCSTGAASPGIYQFHILLLWPSSRESSGR